MPQATTDCVRVKKLVLIFFPGKEGGILPFPLLPTYLYQVITLIHLSHQTKKKKKPKKFKNEKKKNKFLPFHLRHHHPSSEAIPWIWLDFHLPSSFCFSLFLLYRQRESSRWSTSLWDEGDLSATSGPTTCVATAAFWELLISRWAEALSRPKQGERTFAIPITCTLSFNGFI